MDANYNMEERLWDYIDGSGSATEKAVIAQRIAEEQAWRSKYNELQELHRLMQHSLELHEPSMRFTRNVMEAIGKYQVSPAAKNYINKNIIYGIGIFFLAMIGGLLVYGLGQVNWSDSGAGTNLLSKYHIHFSLFFNNSFTTVFMMVNVVLGLMLLDMYLGRRKNRAGAGS